MGIAGSLQGELRTALRTGSYRIASNIARSLPSISLSEALELTVLAAKHDPERFEPMAVRWLSKLLEDRQLSLHEIRWAAERLQDVKEGRVEEAEKALRSFVNRQ
jgi:hypothetical protein